MIMDAPLNKYIEELSQLGLTPGEARVYVALLKAGSSTITPILRLSRVASSNIYDILERLIEKGLVSYVVKGKTKYYQPAPPVSLGDYLQKKQSRLDEERLLLGNIMPSLTAISASNSQSAEIFVGYKGIRTAYEKLLYNVRARDVGLFFYNPPRKRNPDEFFLRLEGVFREKAVRYKGISTENYRNSLFSRKCTWSKMRYVNFPLPMDVDILGGKVLLISWDHDDNPIGILITCPDMAEQLRSYFGEVWEKALE